jgi:hypothetical protein
MKNCLLFMVGSVCRVKQFSLGGKRFADDEEVETGIWKRVRQQPKDFYVCGFRRTDKAVVTSISV